VRVDDDGEVIRPDNPGAEVQHIANTVASRLGIASSITRRTLEGWAVMEVRVKPIRGIIGHNRPYGLLVDSINCGLPQGELLRPIVQCFDQSGTVSPVLSLPTVPLRPRWRVSPSQPGGGSRRSPPRTLIVSCGTSGYSILVGRPKRCPAPCGTATGALFSRPHTRWRIQRDADLGQHHVSTAL
jgi:hypothetical protein